MLKNERGFMLLSVVFLTLIVSLAAMILMNTQAKVQQRNSTLRLTAINLANEQFALLESNSGATIPAEDLKSGDVDFKVETSLSGGELITATVKVKWTFKNQPQEIKFQKIIRVIHSD